METARRSVGPALLLIWDWHLQGDDSRDQDQDVVEDDDDVVEDDDVVAHDFTADNGLDSPQDRATNSMIPDEDFLPFKCIGVTKAASRQQILELIVAQDKEGRKQFEEVPVRIQPEPTNPVDSKAIAIQCFHEDSWHVIGYIISELLGEVHKALSENKIVEVNFFSIRYVLHFPDSGPGYYAGIGIRRKGPWSYEAFRLCSTVKPIKRKK